MEIYETLFGNGESMDYENCCFVCTSTKLGLAIVKIWILKIEFLILIFVRYGVSSSNTFWQLPGMKYANYYNYTDCRHIYETWFGNVESMDYVK